MSGDRTAARLAEALRERVSGTDDEVQTLAADLWPAVDAIADERARQRAAEVAERRAPWIAAQALDDAADEILTKRIGFEEPEDLFQWLTDRSADLRRTASGRLRGTP